jgi:hypothetical protein
MTVRGFNFRGHAREAVGFEGSCSSCTASDNRVYYTGYNTGGGPDYGIAIRNSTPVTVEKNNIAYTTSEGIHTYARESGTTVLTINQNWIHDIGDQNVLGPGAVATPSCMILSDDYYSGGTGLPINGDYTGSVVSGNLMQRCGLATAEGGSKGIIVEDDSSGWIIRDNVFDTPAGECLKFDSTRQADSNQVYNNLMINCGSNYGAAEGQGACIVISANNSGSDRFNSNKIYNNTMYGCANHAIYENCGSGATCNSNEFKNNILQPVSGAKGIHWTKGGTTGNVFDYNLISTTANPAITWLNTGRSCDDVDLAGAGNVDPAGTNCPDPSFVNSSSQDFHILRTSLAKDAGTATGMPSGRTTDIYNTLASAHGLPSMNGGKVIYDTPDIGAFEAGIVAEGGFENSGAWMLDDEGCSFLGTGIISTLVNHGAKAAVLEGRKVGPICGSISQTLTGLSTSTVYRIRGYYQATNASPTRRLRISINGAEISSTNCSVNAVASGWTELSTGCTFTPTSTSAVLKFHVTAPNSGTVTFNLDDVEVVVN